MPSEVAVTQDNAADLERTVVSVVRSHTQRTRGSSIYPYHLQFLMFMTLYMYVWVE